MRPSENIENLVKKLRYKTSTETHDRIFGNLLQVLEKHEKPATGKSKPVIRRTIMKNPFTKLTAAAALIVVALVVISQLGGDGSGVVYGDIVELLANARTLTYSIVTHTPVESMPTLRLQMAFKEPGYMRTTTADGYITVIDWNQNKGITLWPPNQEYIEFEASNYKHDPGQDPFVVVEKLRTLPEQADEILGEKEIDGRALEGFRVTQDDMINTIWIDPQTTQLVRVEIKYTGSPGMNTIMTDFQFNAEIDDSLFSLTPPDGFTRLEVRADVSTVSEDDLIAYLHMWSTWTIDGTFPPTFNPVELPKVTAEMMKQGKFGEGQASDQERNVEAMLMYRGIMFVTQLPVDSNWRYAGENVRYGQAETPVFWYKPTGSQTYRIIYGDLTVKDVSPEDLPD